MRFAITATLTVLMFAGCSPDGPGSKLTFHPVDGDERRYQVYTDMTVDVQRGTRKLSESMSIKMLMHYGVEDQSSTYKLNVSPEYMRLNFKHGGMSSFEQSGYGEDELRTALKDGYTLTVDKESNQLVDVTLNTSSQKLKAELKATLDHLLNDQLSRPGLMHQLAVKKGASQIIKGQNGLPDIRMTVKDFDSELVTLAIADTNQDEPADPHTRIFGYAVIERQTGWLVRQAVVMHVPLPPELRDKGTFRIVSAIYPESWRFNHDLQFLENAEGYELITQEKTDPPVPSLSSSTQAMLNTQGVLDTYDQRFLLHYAHLGLSPYMVGEISASNLAAYDENNQALAIPFKAAGAFQHPGLDHDDAETSLEILPLGWDKTAQALEKLQYIEATLNYHATEHIQVTVPIKPEGSQVEVEGAKVIVQPTDNPYEFLIQLIPGETGYFFPDVTQIDKGELRYPHDQTAADWLSLGEKRLLAIVLQGHLPQELNVKFLDTLPDAVALTYRNYAPEPIESKTVRFYDLNQARPENAAAPITTRLLFDSFQQNDEFKTATLENLAPFSTDAPDLYVTLTPEQAELCTLQETSGLTEQGTPLHFAPPPTADNTNYGATQRMPQQYVYQLQTSDQARLYFYGLKAHIALTCQGTPVWQPLPINLPELSVQVSAAALLGEGWEEHARTLPIKRFLRQYRFLDQQDRVLAITAPRSQPAVGSPLGDKLFDYVDESGHIQIMGLVNRVEKLEATGTPITKTWQHQFEPLPDFKALEEAIQ
ncbi:hypothetical protein [Alcaligenes aquatilis]|uniref:Uncharacterized protein n=1 Tax=Alcaligenes aquatilis TaxID=323284 RepID=A0A3G2HVQ4_9BURK|nr:hypothetical protein [Alcaligenes aquatilis]AYN20848.1 hypothetical protein D3M96_10125 [Alcaligenes aquatilis]